MPEATCTTCSAPTTLRRAIYCVTCRAERDREKARVAAVERRRAGNLGGAVTAQRAAQRQEDVHERLIAPKRKCKDPLPVRPALQCDQSAGARAFDLMRLDIERAALTSRAV